MNYTPQYIANFINEISNLNDSCISKYEMLIDIMSSNMILVAETESINEIRDAISVLNTKLQDKYNDACKVFDIADSLECFLPKYSVCKTPRFLDYAEILISILGMEYILIHNRTLDLKYCDRSIKRDFITLIGRFLFLYNGNIKRQLQDEGINYPNIFDMIFVHSIRIISSLKWMHEEYPQLRILILNLLDSLGESDKSQVYDLIESAIAETSTGNLEISFDVLHVVKESLEKYYNFITNDNNIAEIKTTWLYAYIYKKRFGFIFCKKISKSASAASLPFKFLASSQVFKNNATVLVSNGPKVVLFEAGENKRSSEYVPTQSSAFYNPAIGMFE